MGFEFDFDELKDKLSKMETKVKNEISEKALKAGAKSVLEAQKLLIPVKTAELLGAAQISTFTKSTGESRIYVGFPKESGRRNVEVGWFQNVGVRGKPGLYFMEESLEVSKREALEKMANILREELGK